MALIFVPKPSKKKAMNPERPASGLLLSQVEHLHLAEKNLPLRYRSEKYIKAIRTEGDAAAYIKEVTEAIHQAHADSAKQRTKAARRGKGLEIAAAAARRPKSKKIAKHKKK